MGPLSGLTPQSLRDFATLFLIGYVFRLADGRVRGRRKEGDLQAIVLAVTWSVILFTLLLAIEQPIPAAVPNRLHPVVSIASYLLVSVALGYLWGRISVAVGNSNRIPVSSAYSQVIQHFIEQIRSDTYVEIQMASGESYSGLFNLYDKDPERYTDLHVTLTNPARLSEDGQWVEMTSVDEMLICLKDVRIINRMKG